MRILIATSHRAVVGGVENYVRELLPALVEQGHELALLHEHEAAPGQPAVGDGVADLPRWRMGPAAFSQVSAWRPDLSYAHGLECVQTEEQLVQLLPTILFAHNYHGTCLSGAKRLAWPTIQPCGRVLGLGCLLRYLPRRCGGLNPLTMVRQYAVQKRRLASLAHYRAVLVASCHMLQEFRNHGVPADRLHLVPLFPGAACPDEAPPEDRMMTGQVLFVGRLTALKGAHLLVQAVELASQQLGHPLELVIAGDGPERRELESRAAAKRIPIRFLGWVDGAERTEAMRTSDVLAVPSVWPEPFGLVGIEAGCVGLPAVAFAVGGIPDWLQPGVSGELAPANPPSAVGLADALTRTLQDVNHWRRLRRGAWETSQRFARSAHVANLQSVMRSCTGGIVDIQPTVEVANS